MATNVTIVALSQMVDISLNCHEGIINFQALHTLLHVLIQQLSLKDVAVEFRGDDSDRIQALISTIKSQEKSNILGTYDLASNGSNNKQSKHKKKGTPAAKKLNLNDVIKDKQSTEEKKEKEIRVIERRKDSKEDPDLDPPPISSPPGSLLGVTPDELKTVVVVDSRGTLPQYSVALTTQFFHELQSEMKTVKGKLQDLLDLPSNKDLIEATRNQNHNSPILDMFQLVSLNHRMDAGETAIQKLASLMEELVKHTSSGELMQKVSDIQTFLPSTPEGSVKSMGLTERVEALENAVQELATKGIIPGHLPDDDHSVKGDAPSKDQTKAQEGSIKDDGGVKEEQVKIWAPHGPFNSGLEDVNLEELDTVAAIRKIQEAFNNLNQWVVESIQEMDRSKMNEGAEVSGQVIEVNVQEYLKQLEQLEVKHSSAVERLNESHQVLHEAIEEIHRKIETVLPGGDSTGINAETTMDLSNKLAILEKELLSLAAHAEKLDQDKHDRDKQTEVLMEEIDVLKIVKANREDLEDALGEKADACVINRKVSHDQFDAACDDLTRGIEEALSKLEEQEEMWHVTLSSLQRDVGNKLDKMEVDPLKEFVNSKLKALQEKFKALTALKREQEAAGTKNKLLRDVKCISCDKDVVMRTEMDASFKPKPYAMPPNRNMAPYLAYELDQLRKQQKCVPGGRNLNFIESALKTQGQHDKNSHICNRYCGGSHTVTTPQQRVTRLGHFLDQWGPEIAPLQEEFVKGKTSHMYRARDDSVHSKATKRDSRLPKKQSVRPSTGGEPIAQAERDTMVSAAAHEAIMNDERQRSMSDSSVKKANNIGSVPLNPQPEVASAHDLMRAVSQLSSQQEGPRRSSQLQEGARPSQVQEGSPRASLHQEGSRASQIQTAERTSKVKIQEGRVSQSDARASQGQAAGESRPSKAGVHIAEHRESKLSRKGSQQ